MADPAIWRGGDDLLRCTAISDEAPGVKTFRFASSSGAPIRFHAGQFVTLQLPLSGGEVWRCFTIASSPLRDEAIDLTIKTQASAGTINTSAGSSRCKLALVSVHSSLSPLRSSSSKAY